MRVVSNESPSGLSTTLDKSWKSTCKIILGREIGELKEYTDWLNDYYHPFGIRKSCVSGENVVLSDDHYCSSAHVISQGEEVKETEPLNINEIKDIDSLADAISERWTYTGNKVLGNSSEVKQSDSITNCQKILDSANLQYSSHTYRSFMGRECKYSFGCTYLGKSDFVIRSTAVFKASRIFESHWAIDSSDIYFSFNCAGCHDLLFCFNQRNKRNCIGNLCLPKDKYLLLKQKLLGEITGYLETNRSLPNIFDITRNKPILQKKDLSHLEPDETINMNEIEKGFSSTFKLLFRKEPAKIDEYGDWLSNYTLKVKEKKSPFGCKALFPETGGRTNITLAPEERRVSENEALELGNEKLAEEDIYSFNSLCDNLHKIAFFTAEFTSGKRENVKDCPVIYHASNAYKTYDSTYGQHAGYCSMSLESEYTYGCFKILSSKFCINCYNSTYLTRCFEVDNSTKCSDSYFCHNSEALADCMFCCNVKGLRYAIGNFPLPPAKYKSIKDSLLEQLGDRILKNNVLEMNIYNIGCSEVKA